MYIFYTVYIHVLRNGIQTFIQCIFHTLSVPTAGHWWILDMTAAEIHGVKPLDVFIMFHHLTPKYIICFHWMFSSYHVSPCFYHLTPSKKKTCFIGMTPSRNHLWLYALGTQTSMLVTLGHSCKAKQMACASANPRVSFITSVATHVESFSEVVSPSQVLPFGFKSPSRRKCLAPDHKN